MRISIKKYDNGHTYAVETNDDGSEVVKTLVGQREVGQDISVFVEVLADESAEAMNRLLDALSWLTEQVEARKTRELRNPGKGRSRAAS
jgi:hypothetical protein